MKWGIGDWISRMDDESGQGLVEYALIILMIAIAAAGTLGQIAEPLKMIFTETNTGIRGF